MTSSRRARRPGSAPTSAPTSPADILNDVDFDPAILVDVDFDLDGGVDELGPDFDTVPPITTMTTTTPTPVFTSAQASSPRGTLDDQQRVKFSYLRDMEFFLKLWSHYYEPLTGKFRVGMNPQRVYGLMSGDTTDATYLKEPVDLAEVTEFAQLGADTTVYFCMAQNNDDLGAALVEGDYLHVMNTLVFFKDADLHKRMRRLVVNVRSQQTALFLARKLSLVFADPEIGANFVKFKLFLQAVKSDDTPKHDKVVLYYIVGDDPGDGSDVVGSRLLSMVDVLIPPDEGLMTMSPFYSQVAYYVAWAEEPKHNMPGGTTDDSFTQSRARIVQSVIEANPVIDSAQDLAVQVYKAFTSAGIPWKSPHRHQDVG